MESYRVIYCKSFITLRNETQPAHFTPWEFQDESGFVKKNSFVELKDMKQSKKRCACFYRKSVLPMSTVRVMDMVVGHALGYQEHAVPIFAKIATVLNFLIKITCPTEICELH